MEFFGNRGRKKWNQKEEIEKKGDNAMNHSTRVMLSKNHIIHRKLMPLYDKALRIFFHNLRKLNYLAENVEIEAIQDKIFTY